MFNIVVLTGRICQDLELKTTPSGVSVTTLSIAVPRRYKSGEEQQTDFINLVAWRMNAEFITKYFKKGSMIGIEGSIQTRRYTDQNGNNRTVFEVIVNNAQFVESKKQENSNESGSIPLDETDPLAEVNERLSEFTASQDDDLPF